MPFIVFVRIEVGTYLLEAKNVRSVNGGDTISGSGEAEVGLLDSSCYAATSDYGLESLAAMGTQQF